MDCLGYGPWLDPRTVEYVAAATGGEALMVEELGGDAMQTKARARARASSHELA